MSDEKNKLATSAAWLVLLELDFSVFGLDVIRLCNNNEDVVWNGYTWNAFPFDVELHEITSKANIPTLSLRVSNVNRILQTYIEQTDGGIGAKVRIYVVNSQHLDSSHYELNAEYEIVSTAADNYYITFTLSIMNLFLFKFPATTYMKNFCRWPFKSPMCGNPGCTCYNTCYGYGPCACNNTCYGYQGCSCNNTCYGYATCYCEDYTFWW